MVEKSIKEVSKEARTARKQELKGILGFAQVKITLGDTELQHSYPVFPGELADGGAFAMAEKSASSRYPQADSINITDFIERGNRAFRTLVDIELTIAAANAISAIDSATLPQVPSQRTSVWEDLHASGLLQTESQTN